MPAMSLRQTCEAEQLSQEYLDESNVASILGVTGAFAYTALVVVALRLYVRIRMLRFVAPDDQAMILFVLMAVCTFVCLHREFHTG
jgi:hypothetical protein